MVLTSCTDCTPIEIHTKGIVVQRIQSALHLASVKPWPLSPCSNIDWYRIIREGVNGG